MTKRRNVLKDFFVSYNSNDKAWAEWIAWTLEANGFSTIIQEWDFRPGGDFVLEMQKATNGTKQTITVLSDEYLQAAFTQPEWAQAFARDPKGDDRTLLPVRVTDCSPEGLLMTRIYADLVGLSEEESREELLKSLEERAKPVMQPSFPGGANRSRHSVFPEFPGVVNRRDTTLRTTSSRHKHLADELEKGRIRKTRLFERGEDTTQVADEILALKRELRRGGQLRPGDQLGDRYLLLDQLGRGGYATVWKAYDNQENCDVAIKALNTSEAANPTSVERFFRGARIMSEFADNDGIVTVLDPKCDDDGFLYFVMELIPSGNLHEAVLDGRKSAADAVPIMQRILAILEQAHSHPSRCVHRDIKPNNVLLTLDGELKLTDFDLVTANNTTGGTRTGMLGTVVFAAPEQLFRPQDADHRADIFGVGMTGVFVIFGDDLPLLAWKRPEEFIDGRLEIPEDVSDVASFLLTDGKVKKRKAEGNGEPTPPPRYSLKQMFDEFFAAIPAGNLEDSTLRGMHRHEGHLLKLFHSDYPIRDLTIGNLQEYVNKRAKQKTHYGTVVQSNTIHKELVTLGTVWRWAERLGKVVGTFPRRGVRLPKSDELPPFQTWDEIERQIDFGGLSPAEQSVLWDALYLRRTEIDQLLTDVHAEAKHPFIYPMVVMAAHTGARRAELLRSRRSDFDFESGVVTIREKKRVHGKNTTRRVAMSPTLVSAMTAWFQHHPGGQATFCHTYKIPRSRIRRDAAEPLTGGQAHRHFEQTLKSTRWEKVKGWHCLRHSFISNLASQGIDQRIIDDFVGHTTEQMRRRYRHLFPDVKQAAIDAVFG
jgi:serine/threonine protein kinase